ncbi:MAG: protein kinase [Chloroflexota bacterium]
MSFAIGETVGPYRITDRLGQGGMATVFRAYHAKLDRYVAIKVLHAAFKEDPTFLARFQREAQIVARLEHPSIVPTYDFSEHNGEPYLVMKFIEGNTLKARLSQKPLTLDETIKIMTAVAEALTYAHEQGVLHRDIKPSNILLEKGVTPYLADFGLARIASAGESTLSQDMMIGTPQYMSPEQAQGAKNLDGTTDVYSLAVVLYELVVGRVPFNADTPYAIIHDHIYSPLPIPSQVNPQVPYEVERMLLKALSKDPASRYVTPVQMVDAFREGVRTANLTELSAGSYRVPITIPTTANNPPSWAAGIPPSSAGTPPPVIGIPAPVPPTSDVSASYLRQQRRANLWMLSGFGLLLLTCITGLFVALSTYQAASSAGLFTAAQPTLLTLPTSTVLEPTEIAVVTTASLESTEAPEVSATVLSVTPSIAPTIQNSETPANTIAPIANTSNFPILSIPQAEQEVRSHPDDPRAHLALAAALGNDNRRIRALQEYQAGLRLLKGNANLALEIAQQMTNTPKIDAALPAILYAFAYGAAGKTHPQIQNEAGRNLYQYVSGLRPQNLAAVGRLSDAATEYNSAGLYAFTALGYHVVGVDDNAKQAMDKAVALEPDLPEVQLVRGIIALAQNSPKDAAAAFDAIAKTADAPGWVVDEAKRLAQKGS